MSRSVVVFLADGFEECEGLLVVDLLRRAEVDVITASIMDRIEIKSSHGITLQADARAEEVDYSSVDMIVLPGGLPGTTYLGENEIVKEQCLSFAKNKTVAAICAAPSVFAKLGFLKNRKATSYPGAVSVQDCGTYLEEEVVTDDHIVTSRGVGTAIPFALRLVEILKGTEVADQIAGSIIYRR